MSTEPADVVVRHAPDEHRYELLVDDAMIGEARYVPFDHPSGAQRIFFHTVVDDAYGGRGLGATLVGQALADTVAAGIAIVPVCPFVSAYLRRHREYAADVVAVRSEHLAALQG